MWSQFSNNLELNKRFRLDSRRVLNYIKHFAITTEHHM